MSHRLVLMLSAVFMMFAVFGFVFAYGAFIGDNDDIAWGNLGLGVTMITTSAVILLWGLSLKKKADVRVNATIADLLAKHACIEATEFAKDLGITVDDARDMLDTRAREQNWRRLELENYNAKYFVA
ncbi:MAG: hypothetical protein ACK5BQ_06750 [Ignavibacteria bacterium]|jgi:hypothetical protein